MAETETDNDAVEILLASGVDVPTALEASRVEPAEPPRKSGCLGLFMFVAVVFAYTVLH